MFILAIIETNICHDFNKLILLSQQDDTVQSVLLNASLSKIGLI